MTNFERLAAKATKRPYHVEIHHESNVSIPMMKDSEGDAVADVGMQTEHANLANAAYLTIAANYVERLVALVTAVAEWPDDDDALVADALGASVIARTLLASIEQAAKGEQ